MFVRLASSRWAVGLLVFLSALLPLLTLEGQQPPKKDQAALSPQDKEQLAAALKFMSETVGLLNKGQAKEAEAPARKALEIHLKVWGEEHADTANSYFNLAAVMRNQGQRKAAAELGAKALEIRRKIYGEDHLETARSYYNVALDLNSLAQFAKAEELDRKALAIRRKALGEWHPATAACYNNLASDLHQQAKYAEAEAHNRKALEIYIKLHGEEHIDTAQSYGNLAQDMVGQGQFAAAEQLDRKTLAILLKLQGEQSPLVIWIYNNLAGGLVMQGQYAEAEQLYRRALAISIKLAGDGGLGTAEIRHNLAGDLLEQGQFAAAEQLNRAALEVFRKFLGDDHPQTAKSLKSLARGLAAQGQHAEAERLHQLALQTTIRALGEYHPATARAYSALAGDLHDQFKYPQAADLYRKALDIFRKVLGEDHPSTSACCSNLAVELSQMGQHAAAEPLYRQALATHRKLLGEEHPDTALFYQLLAFCLYCQGDYANAEKVGVTAATAYQAARLRISYTGLGRSSFGVKQSPLRPLAVVLARNDKPVEAWKYLEEDLGRGVFDDVTSRYTRKLTTQELQSEQALQAKLANIEKKLGADGKIDAREFADLQRQREQVMGGLVQMQAELEKKYSVAAGQIYGLAKIQGSLAEDAAVVAWVDIGFGVGAKDASGDHWAVVVRNQGKPAWVKLKGTGPEGSWQPKDYEALNKLREVLQYPDPNTDWRAWKDDVVKQRLRPLTEHLDGVTQLIVLPSERMAGIPIEALTDRYQISYAPSGTMYAWLQERRKDFGKGAGAILALADPVFSKEQAQLSLSPKDAARHLMRGALKPLPGTRGEANAIAKLFDKGNIQMFVGPDANSLNLDRLAETKKLSQFRFVHLATHGFADPKGGLNSFLALTPENFALSSYAKLSAAHMLRTWQLDADLVTLSACTTALGEYQGGEGYVGFSQALFLAGAHTVVVSQWPVHDLSTTLLMERFYENLLGARPELKGPAPKVVALAESRRWLKELTREEALTKLKQLGIPVNEKELVGERPFEHPYFWAPFILVGDPGTKGPK